MNMNVMALNLIFPRTKKTYLVCGLLSLGLLIWLILFSLGIWEYSGSKAVYALFSLVTGAMLLSGIWQVSSYGYLFLTVFLWLGFWLKLTIHAILNYPFVEPVGAFVGGGGPWDEVLYTATVASLGVMLAKMLYDFLCLRVTATARETKPVVPPWYAERRNWLWLALALTAITSYFANWKFGVQEIGLAPRTVLIWPLNAVISWLLNIGLATGIAVLLWWDIGLKKNLTGPFYAIIAEAFFSSVFVLSRSIYVFHAIPQLLAAFRFRQAFSEWAPIKTILLGATLVSFLIISISTVTTFRNYLYQSGAYSSTEYQVSHSRREVLLGMIEATRLKINISSAAERPALLVQLRELLKEKLKQEHILAEEKEKWVEAMKSNSAQSRVLLNEFGYQITDGFLTRILQLSVDRWIGVEGIMAVQSYPEKKASLLKRALSEKPEGGTPDVYQTISKSMYLKSGNAKFRFASLPGAAAFLYYSNSLLVVTIGMFFLSLIVLIVESFIDVLTANPILCSLYGVVMANNVAQFGVSPRLSLPYFFMLALGILLVGIIHTNFFTRALCKLSLHCAIQPRND